MESSKRFSLFSLFSPKKEEKTKNYLEHDNFSCSKNFLLYLTLESEKLQKDDSKNNSNKNAGLLFILETMIEFIKNSHTDPEAMQNMMKFFINIPIQPEKQDLQSFGEFLQISNPPKEPQGIPGGPLTGDNLNYFRDLYNKHFIKSYEGLLKWDFDYSFNHPSEILTQGLGDQWQTDKMKMNAINTPHPAYADFKRKYLINNMDPTLCYLIEVNSMTNTKEIGEKIGQSNIPCLIRSLEPPALYYYAHDFAVIEEFTNSPAKLKEFDTYLEPTAKIRQLDESELGMISNLMGSEIRDKFISININHLFQDLKEPEMNNIPLLQAWLERHGGQHINRFFDDSIEEHHFGEHFGIAKSVALTQNWCIKNNTLTFNYDMNLMSIVGDDGKVYGKYKDSKFLSPIAVDDIDTHPEDFEPVMKLNSEIIVVVENNVVKPKLVEYKIDCKASLSDNGVICLQSPVNNTNILKQLTQGADKGISIGMNKRSSGSA